MGVDVHDMDVKGLGSDTVENVIKFMEPLGESLHILARINLPAIRLYPT